MLAFLKKLFAPMNIAAYIAWAAIGTELWFDELHSTGLVQTPWLGALAVALHSAFLLCFVLCIWQEKPSLLQKSLALLLVCVALMICTISRFSSAPVLLIVASSVLATLFSKSRLVLLFVGINLLLYFVYRNLWHAQQPMLSVLIYSSFQLFAMLMSWYSRQAEIRRDELMVLNAELIATRSLLAETVRDSERLRLARELHDVAGHKLTALKLNLAALVRQPAEVKQQNIEMCAHLADELLTDIRGVVQQMRVQDGLNLQAAIEKMAAPFPRPHLQLAIDDHAQHAPMQHAQILLRTIQEALTNTARHSQAQQLWVVVQRNSQQWSLHIRDDGRMASDWQKGNGLKGMTERLENSGGGLRCAHASSGGMQIDAWLPVAL